MRRSTQFDIPSAVRRHARWLMLAVLIGGLPAIAQETAQPEFVERAATRQNVNLRKLPDTESRIVAVLKPAVPVKILSMTGVFARVRRLQDGREGYIKMDYLFPLLKSESD